jgi:hypothetical protein
MQLEMGSTPASGVASRRLRRVVGPRAESLSSQSVRRAEKMTGEGANHDARGGRAPPQTHSYGLDPYPLPPLPVWLEAVPVSA